MRGLGEGATWSVAPHRSRRPTDIEDLLRWAYATQRVDLMLGIGMTDQERSVGEAGTVSSLWALERIGLLGTMIDRSNVVMSAPVHPDAATIHDAVMLLDRPVAMLVMQHARERTRPCSGAGVRPAFRFVHNRRGGPLVVFAPEDVSRNYGHCPIVWEIDAAEITTRRGVYAVWRAALMDVGLRLLVDDQLLDVSPTGPVAPKLKALDNTQTA